MKSILKSAVVATALVAASASYAEEIKPVDTTVSSQGSLLLAGLGGAAGVATVAIVATVVAAGVVIGQDQADDANNTTN